MLNIEDPAVTVKYKPVLKAPIR